MPMLDYIAFAVALLCSVACAAFLLPWLLRFCHKHALYDLPNERKMHKTNIPRLGGTIFLPAMLTGGGAAIVVSNLFGIGIHEIGISSIAIMVGLLIIYLTGLYDDLFGMRAKPKFLLQLVAASIMPAFGLYTNDLQGLAGMHHLAPFVAYPITIFLVLLVVNSINLIDGIDGLAASLCIITLVGFTVLFAHLTLWIFAVVCLTLISALMVFLWFNLWGSCERNTKTFMGDSGSLVLGYTLAYLGLKYSMDNGATIYHQPYAVLATVTLLLLPTLDLIRVAFTRLLQGKHIFEADKQHIHHLFASAGFTAHQSLVAIIVLHLFFCAFNTVLYQFEVNINIILALDIAVFAILHAWLYCRIKRVESIPIQA